MIFSVKFKKGAQKELLKIEKSNPQMAKKISLFIEKLENTPTPATLPNAKALKGFEDNRYRWRLGDYRIIGIIENNEFKIIQIIKIDKRDERTYKGL